MTQHLGGRKFSKKKVGLKQSRAFRGILLGVMPVFGVAFSAAFLASSIFAPINTSNAAETTVTASVSYGAYSLTLTAAQAVSLPLNVQVDGVMTVASSNLSVSTTAPSGYALYVGMTGTNSYTNSLIHSTDSNNTITSSGTIGNPVALTNGTWGYAIPSGTANIESNGFDASYTTLSSATPSTAKFASVPNDSSSPDKIAHTSTSNTTADTYPVYYGVRAGFETPTGSYSNKILYTAVADAGANAALYVSPDETPALDGGETLTLTTTLVSSSSDIDYSVYLLTQSEYQSVTSGTTDVRTLTSELISGCQRVAGVDMLQITCTSPARTVGDYYLYVNVPDYGLHYAKAFSYVPNFYNITTMQEMTADICNDTKYVVTPKATIFNGTNVYGQTGTASAAANADTGNALSRPNHPNDPNYVPQTTLTDTRQTYLDGALTTKTYTVRKLADGNCWMTDNLALNWNSSRTFTSGDTNTTSSVTVNVNTQALSATGGDATTDEATAWKETSAGTPWEKWLSRSTNNAQENTYSAEAVRTGENQYLGTYYNWYTATLGTGLDGDPSTEIGTDSTADICPKGWQLPRYTGSGSWMTLIRDTYHVISTQGDQSTVSGGNTAANNTLHGFPFSLPYSGNVHRGSGSTVLRGADGYFWSAAPSSSTNSRRLLFYGTAVWPEGSDYRTLGFSVRCVAQQ